VTIVLPDCPEVLPRKRVKLHAACPAREAGSPQPQMALQNPRVELALIGARVPEREGPGAVACSVDKLGAGVHEEQAARLKFFGAAFRRPVMHNCAVLEVADNGIETGAKVNFAGQVAAGPVQELAEFELGNAGAHE